MCGIFGIVAVAGREPSLDDSAIERLRDRMVHRGPDDAGLVRRRNAVFAHRRLSVIDPTPAGRQPMETPDGRFIITYNGELYNDAELRRELALRGVPAGGFRSNCDTETVLHAFATWGTGAFERMRGMYALAIYDTREHLLTLARDPLGVKPLYVWQDSKIVIFASEPGPILAHSLVSARPNMRMVSAYLTTIRTVLGNETLFEGLRALGAGQMAQCHMGGRAPVMRFIDLWRSGSPSASPDAAACAGGLVRDAVTDSVRAHMRSDVPICALLSGGLDSSAIASVAVGETDALRTYCAGAARADDAEIEDDFSCARHMAEHLGTRHAEAIVTGEQFRERWPWMVREMGTPLSTPNEVAIHAVAARLREDGCIVTISGEGADELFAGYEEPMLTAMQFERQRRAGGIDMSPGRFQLESNAWIQTSVKSALFNADLWHALSEDAWLSTWYEQAFDTGALEVGDQADPLEAHLRFHRRVNLTGLLQRMDTATMLASVEGRTPFADVRLAALAESLPMHVKFAWDVGEETGGAIATDVGARSKIALRSAFADVLPQTILQRKKASFPLPFQEWLADCGPWLRQSRFAQAVFTEAAIDAVAQSPSEHWRLAWPMVNVALWGDVWW
ncbi:MAG: asparagine synthase (glutamine-hydrolyzing) [Phycisphaeraceae bacterium]|nr:MAG: asparagine synthase (glutamine-hydrolyzing) [Phycisphaeraceae bacterium]